MVIGWSKEIPRQMRGGSYRESPMPCPQWLPAVMSSLVTPMSAQIEGPGGHFSAISLVVTPGLMMSMAS